MDRCNGIVFDDATERCPVPVAHGMVVNGKADGCAAPSKINIFVRVGA